MLLYVMECIDVPFVWVGKQTVDTYYRHCSSAYYLAKVAVPLLCFNSLDDPVCTKEAIPWDESM
jgi:abhydrolase domain-containing protein 1/3